MRRARFDFLQRRQLYLASFDSILVGSDNLRIVRDVLSSLEDGIYIALCQYVAINCHDGQIYR